MSLQQIDPRLRIIKAQLKPSLDKLHSSTTDLDALKKKYRYHMRVCLLLAVVLSVVFPMLAFVILPMTFSLIFAIYAWLHIGVQPFVNKVMTKVHLVPPIAQALHMVYLAKGESEIYAEAIQAGITPKGHHTRVNDSLSGKRDGVRFYFTQARVESSASSLPELIFSGGVLKFIVREGVSANNVLQASQFKDALKKLELLFSNGLPDSNIKAQHVSVRKHAQDQILLISLEYSGDLFTAKALEGEGVNKWLSDVASFMLCLESIAISISQLEHLQVVSSPGR